ncbi:MAG: hypothetical protein JSV41_06840 [Gemmatimonadota bacterium]|nr:MAG: hypothetical protein JSV41_06840 [Gemmatimonadota bacterium]
MRRLYCSLLAAVVCVGSLVWPVSLMGQSIWMEPLNDRAVFLELLKPDFATAGDWSFATSAGFLSARWSLGSNIVLVADLPFAYGDFEGEVVSEEPVDTVRFDESGATIGNPYIGVELRFQDFPVFGEIGLRAPLTQGESFLDEVAAVAGGYADFVDRLEAFLPDVLVLMAAANYTHQFPGGTSLRFRLAPVFWVDTAEAFEDDSEMFLLYSAQGWYEWESVIIGVGFSGRWQWTVGQLDFDERTVHQLVISASWLSNSRFRPGVQFRLPLDDDLKNNYFSWVFGLNLQVALD